MKLTTVFFFAACLQVSAKVFSQKVSLEVSNESLTQVFKKIEDKTSFRFVYSKVVVCDKLVKQANFKRTHLNEVLDELLAEFHLSYKMINDSLIAIGQLPEMAAGLNKIKVTGRVTDSTGRPIEGVTVKIKGAAAGTSTNRNGEFSIETEHNDYEDY